MGNWCRRLAPSVSLNFLRVVFGSDGVEGGGPLGDLVAATRFACVSTRDFWSTLTTQVGQGTPALDPVAAASAVDLSERISVAADTS